MVLAAGHHHPGRRPALQLAIAFILLRRQALFDPLEVIRGAGMGKFGGIVNVLAHPAVQH
ncbi:hypothetical protein KPZU09_70980 [Klebsiella pneumoniae]|uniref:Uncharacterized protein n=1 Tax=Klebsiella pneumoniae TaxID=573 RepID=A0A919I2F7_KLEPN|nr:hypothetical protein KPZU09_70980 [Klebsiella pneumoniae]